MKALLQILMVSLVVVSCTKPPIKRDPVNTTIGNAEPAIVDALRDLTSMQAEGGFVIVKERTADKIVQFSGGAKFPITVDLPAGKVAEEAERAKKLVEGMQGVHKTMLGYQLNFEHDVERAAQFAMRVFKDVYLFKDDAPVRIYIEDSGSIEE
jgi:hypothetical protein